MPAAKAFMRRRVPPPSASGSLRVEGSGLSSQLPQTSNHLAAARLIDNFCASIGSTKACTVVVITTSEKGETSVPTIVTRVAIFKEGESFVGLCPELNVSSFGDTIPEAKLAVKEAIEAFIEDCDARGTLNEILDEAGFVQDPTGQWQPRVPVAEEQIAVGQ